MKTTGESSIPKFLFLVFLGHPNIYWFRKLLTGGFNLQTLKKTQCSFPGQGFGVNLTSLYNVDPRQLAGSILVYKILTRGRGEWSNLCHLEDASNTRKLVWPEKHLVEWINWFIAKKKTWIFWIFTFNYSSSLATSLILSPKVSFIPTNHSFWVCSSSSS